MAARNSSGSGSRPTTRCAVSRHPASRRDALRDGRPGSGDDPLPPHRLGAGDHRHVAPRAKRETAWAQIVADQLGCDIDEVEVLHNDTSRRTIPADDFFTGVFETALEDGEVLTEVRVPKLAGSTGWAYLKAHRRAQDWATGSPRSCTGTTAPSHEPRSAW